MKSINQYHETFFPENNSINTKYNILNNLPSELLTKIINILEMNSLKKLNQTSKKLNYFTDNNNAYINEKTNQLFAKQIIFEFKPFINIVEYQEGLRSYNIQQNLERDNIKRLNNAKINKAQEQCDGKLVVQLNENTEVSIDYKSFVYKNFFNGNKSLFTSEATVNNVFNDEKIEKAITVAQKHINELLKANFKKALSI
ncbi:MAG: hypothetical protein H0V82_13150 [Candidatus Protochlamydia sp.]|nr:hypothetical protein [Candidatus Protochlamydia sp.]